MVTSANSGHCRQDENRELDIYILNFTKENVGGRYLLILVTCHKPWNKVETICTPAVTFRADAIFFYEYK